MIMSITLYVNYFNILILESLNIHICTAIIKEYLASYNYDSY